MPDQIDRYMGELDCADELFAKTGMRPVEARLSRVIKKLAHYRKEALTLRTIEQLMDTYGETQVSLTDPDCRAMATTSKQPRVVGYNVQSVVETKHHLIVAHEVTNLGYDCDVLSMMALAVKDAMASDEIEAIADDGTTVAKRSSPQRRLASLSQYRSRTLRTRERPAASTKLTLSMMATAMLIVVLPENG